MSDNETIKKPNKKDELLAELSLKLEQAEGLNQRLAAQLEYFDKKKLIEHPESAQPSRIQVLSFGPKDRLASMSEDFVKNNPDKHYRFINTHQTVYALRRAQGYEPVKDANKEEVRYMDCVLASMPKNRFQEEIVKPRESLSRHHHGDTLSSFKEAGAELGVKTFGEIKYDKPKE
jgi:hypothetical protein